MKDAAVMCTSFLARLVSEEQSKATHGGMQKDTSSVLSLQDVQNKTSAVMRHSDKQLVWLQVPAASQTLPIPDRHALQRGLLRPTFVFALILNSQSPMGIHPIVELLLMNWQSCP